MGVVNVEPAVASPPPTSLLIGDPKVETLEGLIAKLAAFYQLPTADDSLAKALAFVGFAGRGGTALGEYIDGNIAAAGKMAVEGQRGAGEPESPGERTHRLSRAALRRGGRRASPREIGMAGLRAPAAGISRPAHDRPDRSDRTRAPRLFRPIFCAAGRRVERPCFTRSAGLSVREPNRDRRVRFEGSLRRPRGPASPRRLRLRGQVRDRGSIETGRKSRAAPDRGDRGRHPVAQDRAASLEFARRGGRGGRLSESGMKFARTGIPIFILPSATALAWRRLGFRSAGAGLSKIGVVTALAPI